MSISFGRAGGLGAMFGAAAQGIARAHERADGAAKELARVGVETDRVTLSGAQPTPEPDVVGGLVDLRVARYQQSANVAVLKTADEMSKELLSL